MNLLRMACQANFIGAVEALLEQSPEWCTKDANQCCAGLNLIQSDTTTPLKRNVALARKQAFACTIIVTN